MSKKMLGIVLSHVWKESETKVPKNKKPKTIKNPKRIEKKRVFNFAILSTRNLTKSLQLSQLQSSRGQKHIHNKQT